MTAPRPCFRRIEQVILVDCSQAANGSDVPDFMRTDGDDRIWNGVWALSDAAGGHDHHHFSICHLQRHAPAFGTINYGRSGDGHGRSRLSRTDEGSISRPVIVVHTLTGYRDANEGYVAAELRKAGFATLTYDSF